MNKKVFLRDLGALAYKDAWDYQDQLFQGIIDIKIANRKNNIKNKTPNYLLFVSHPHVYTLGKSGDLSNLILPTMAPDRLLGILFLIWKISLQTFTNTCAFWRKLSFLPLENTISMVFEVMEKPVFGLMSAHLLQEKFVHWGYVVVAGSACTDLRSM
jgi:hypothetical protein